MRRTTARRNHGAMNDTHHQQHPPGGGTDHADAGSEATGDTPRPDEGFDAHRLRSVAEMRRSSSPRMIAGVCTGMARHLDIDPILVRIVFAVLVFAGGAGVIVYAAFWFLVPAEDARTSIAADWFRLGDSEEKVRVGGLVLAGAVAVLAAIGDNGWGWGAGVPWGLLPLALIVYLFVVRPRRRREARAAATEQALQSPINETVEGGLRTTTYTLPPERRSWALTGLTVSVIAIAVAITRIVSDSGDGTAWTTYVVVALTIIALAVLLSTVVGDGGPLILLGLVLAVILGLGALLPNPRVGAQQIAPIDSTDVSSTYQQGVGLLELDLSRLVDPDELRGRTITLENGVGQVKVLVPNGLDVAVDSGLDVGEIVVFDRTVSGTDNRLDVPADPNGPALTLIIDQKVGNIEVIRR